MVLIIVTIWDWIVGYFDLKALLTHRRINTFIIAVFIVTCENQIIAH